MNFLHKNIVCFVLFLAFVCTFSFAQKDKATIKAAQGICDCLEKYDMSSKSQKEAEGIFSQCFLEKGFSNFLEIANENNIDASEMNEETGRKIGTVIGLKMAAINCKPYLAFAQGQIDASSSESAEESNEAKKEGYIYGKVVRVEKNNYAYIVIKDESGKDQRLLWLYYFDNSDKFVDNPNAMIGKSVEVKWYEGEIYLPSENAYFDMKIISELNEN